MPQRLREGMPARAAARGAGAAAPAARLAALAASSPAPAASPLADPEGKFAQGSGEDEFAASPTGGDEALPWTEDEVERLERAALGELERREVLARQDRVRHTTVQRAKAVAAAREDVDESSSDSHEERVEREAARRLLSKTSGSPFSAVRVDDAEMLRAFMLVEGSARLLALRSKDPNDGGRSLLHAAAFWNSLICLELLLKVGAEVCVLDSACSRVTPLLEAARAGNMTACRRLLEAGASLLDQDSCGDSGLHWCARKGQGPMIPALVRFAEKAAPGSGIAALRLVNHRGRTAADVAHSHAVRKLVLIEMEKAAKVEAAAAEARQRALASEVAAVKARGRSKVVHRSPVSKGKPR